LIFHDDLVEMAQVAPRLNSNGLELPLSDDDLCGGIYTTRATLTKKEGGCILLTRILIVDNDDEAINLNG
jgi:hypothetical protein